jgi:hypothetical protein
MTEIEEVPSELGEPDCKLINPFVVKKNQMVGTESSFTLEQWLTDYSDQNICMVHSDKILTIINPNEDLINKYKSINS